MRSCLNMKNAVKILTVLLAPIMLMNSSSAMAGKKYSLKKTSFSALKGWRYDNHAEAFSAYMKSCARLVGSGNKNHLRPNKNQAKARYIAACRRAAKLGETPGSIQARKFFEKNFTPYRIRWRGSKNGLFTGYYEPEYEGALEPSKKYPVPVLQAPDNLVALAGKTKKPKNFPGGLTSALQHGSKLKPLPSRAGIENGELASIAKPLVWLADPVDAFFLHIQGSGRILLPGGGVMRLGFAGRNGHPYSSIGKVLLKRGILKPNEMSMQSVQKWLRDNKQQARPILQSNKSYIFFREVMLDAGLGPIGGEGIPLTAGRSMAIDRRFHAYGLPIWVDTAIPDEGARNYTKFRRLMMAQDTGAAIKGAIRGDIFFGTGKAAGEVAGRVKEPGRMYLLLPKSGKKLR